MILAPDTIRELGILSPCRDNEKLFGVSRGLSHAGYDLSLDGHVVVPSKGLTLAAAQELFTMPDDLVGVVHDKSTWARIGLTVQNTVVEPGWRGYLTLELVNHTNIAIALPNGVGIAQVVFHRMERPSSRPYNGKYQDQPSGPQRAKFEDGNTVLDRVTQESTGSRARRSTEKVGV